MRKLGSRAMTPKERHQRYWLRRVLWLNAFKDRPCVDCGQTYPPECMDFDHVRGCKADTVGRLFNKKKWEAVLREIKKCELVCSNCHRLRTSNRTKNRRANGTKNITAGILQSTSIGESA